MCAKQLGTTTVPMMVSKTRLYLTKVFMSPKFTKRFELYYPMPRAVVLKLSGNEVLKSTTKHEIFMEKLLLVGVEKPIFDLFHAFSEKQQKSKIEAKILKNQDFQKNYFLFRICSKIHLISFTVIFDGFACF